MVVHFPSAPPPTPPLPRIYYITLLGGLYILTFGKFIFSFGFNHLHVNNIQIFSNPINSANLSNPTF